MSVSLITLASEGSRWRAWVLVERDLEPVEQKIFKDSRISVWLVQDMRMEAASEGSQVSMGWGCCWDLDPRAKMMIRFKDFLGLA